MLSIGAFVETPPAVDCLPVGVLRVRGESSASALCVLSVRVAEAVADLPH